MPAPYATPEDLTPWLPTGTTVAEPARLLARASELMDATVRCSYDVDGDGLPTDATVAQALSDAVCAQVEYWATEVGEEHDIAGMGGRQIRLLSLSMDALPPELAPRAHRALLIGGLLTPVPSA